MSSLAKITISGEAKTNPEKRFTENNLAVTSFMMDFGFENQEKLVKIIALGKLADKVAETVKKGKEVIVDGKLQTFVKNENGTDRRLTEINAQGIEIIEKSNGSYQTSGSSSEEMSEVSNDDLIGEDEIPF